MTIRFRSRYVHAAVVEHLRTQLTALGWVAPPTNFGAMPVRVVDYQPDERGERIEQNTVAVSLGDLGSDEDRELGASAGGLRSMEYPIFIDVYMSEQALSVAIGDDIRDILQHLVLPIVDKATGQVVPNARLQVEDVMGPTRPQASIGAEQFKRFWRVIKLETHLYYQT